MNNWQYWKREAKRLHPNQNIYTLKQNMTWKQLVYQSYDNTLTQIIQMFNKADKKANKYNQHLIILESIQQMFHQADLEINNSEYNEDINNEENNNEEVINFINNYSTELINEISNNVIWINEPNDYNKCLITIQQAQSKHPIERYVKSNNIEGNFELIEIDYTDPYICYYLNNISSLDSIFDYIDSIYNIETKPFKLNIFLGVIIEECETNNKYNYTATPPHD